MRHPGLDPRVASGATPRRRGRGAVAGWLLLALAVTACALAPGQDVPYVPSPDGVVDAMLRLAGVGPDDVVYDLGSGDGRIVIAAAREFGARGVGIEIDPRLVRQSLRAARWAGVAERVRFVQQDFFQVDLAPATVVTLYLSPALNARLRPKLLRELRPGARIVSHLHGMGDWPPEREVRIDVQGRQHTIYGWVVRGDR